jgi:hypothetical protein
VQSTSVQSTSVQSKQYRSMSHQRARALVLLAAVLSAAAKESLYREPPQQERDALSEIFNQMNGRYWTDALSWRSCRADWDRNADSWLQNCSVREWRGVEIRGGRVVGLNLSHSNLQGQFSTSFCELRRLQ